MTLLPVAMMLFGLSFAGVAIGSYINFRSVRSGHGPSPTGLAIQMAAIVVVLLVVSVTFFVAIEKSGLWQATILLIPILAFGVILVIGAVQNLRGRRRP